MADDFTTDALDYLGRQQPIGQKSISGLPSTDVALLGGGGPVPSAGGVPGAPAVASGTPGTTTTSPSPVLSPQSASPLALAAGALGQVDQIGGWLRSIFGGGGPGGLAGLTPQDYGLAALAEHGPTDLIPGTGGPAGGAFGALAEPSLSALMSSLSAAAPIWGGLTGFIDLVATGKVPGQALIEAIFGLDQPSKEWLNYGGNVRNTLQGEQGANMDLARALATASPDQIAPALQSYYAALGKAIPGWTPPQGVDLPDLPGASGKNHEWGTMYDFGGELSGLRAELGAARQGLPTEQRQSAFLDAARAWQLGQDEVQAQRNQAYQDWLGTYSAGIGSA